MKNLPGSIVLGPYCFDIIRAPKEDFKEPSDLGDFDLQESQIRISEECPTHLVMETLWHEIAHAMLHVSSLSHLFTSKEEEAICDCFGVWMSQLTQQGFVFLRKEPHGNAQTRKAKGALGDCPRLSPPDLSGNQNRDS